MRTMLRFEIDTEAGNELIRSGEMEKGLDQMLEMLQPEAAYFFASDGHRGGILVFDLTDPSRLPSLTEPLWMSLKARVEMCPAMNRDDLKSGLAALRQQ